MAGKRDGLFKRGRIWWHRDPVTGRQASTRCTDIEAARAYHRARERVAADPTTAAAAEAELGHWCDQTVALKRRDSSESTIRFYTQKLGQVLGVLGRDFRLAELTPPAVDRYVSQRRADGVTDHTIVHEFSCLTQVLKLAKRAGCFPGDLAALRPLDLHTRYVPRKRALPREEVVRLLAVLEPARGAFVALTVGLGLRLSEAFRLLPSDVDLEHGRVFVGGTKTEQSQAHLPILSVMRSLVASGSKFLPLEPWQNIVRDLAAACRRAGIQPCTPNDLRRSHATLLIEAGVDRDVVRRLLRHTTAAMVDRVYGKPRPEALGALAEQVVGLLPPIETSCPGRGTLWTSDPPAGGLIQVSQISDELKATIAQQVSDSGTAPCSASDDGAAENQGASSRVRTGDLRFTNPLEGSEETASSEETAAYGDMAARGQAWGRDGEHTSTQQCSYPWDDVVCTAPLTEHQSDSGYIDLSVPLRGRCPNAARGADDSYSSANGAATHSHAAGMVSEEISGRTLLTESHETNRRVTLDRFDLAAAYARALSRQRAA